MRGPIGVSIFQLREKFEPLAPLGPQIWFVEKSRRECSLKEI